jgi:hypothetical protein
MPVAAGAADLTIWWSKGYYPSEDEGLRRIVAGFEDETQTKVDLTFVSMPDLATKPSPRWRLVGFRMSTF